MTGQCRESDALEPWLSGQLGMRRPGWIRGDRRSPMSDEVFAYASTSSSGSGTNTRLSGMSPL